MGQEGHNKWGGGMWVGNKLTSREVGCGLGRTSQVGRSGMCQEGYDKWGGGVWVRNGLTSREEEYISGRA